MKNYITLFYVSLLVTFSANSQNITQAEYFWDTDPGAGNAIVLSVLDGNFNTALESIFENTATLPSIGNHILGLRVKSNDGNWGVAYKRVFKVDANNNTNNLCKITQAEYFWDTDPGVGNGIVMLAFDGSFDAALEQLSHSTTVFPTGGLHLLNIRIKSNDGNWGVIYKRVIGIDLITGTVDLAFPIDNAPCQALTDTLRWNGVAGIADFEYECATDINFNSIIYTNVITDTLVELTNLSGGESYFWRVRARNGSLTGLWSSIWSFSTVQIANVSETICSGETYTFGSQSLSQTGNYTEVFTANGCDSTVTLTLTVLSSIANTITETICGGETYILGSQQISQSGIYDETFASNGGCDSIVTLNLTVSAENTTTLVGTICAGDTYTFGSQTLSQTGVYSQTHTGINGCDSIINLNLTVFVLPTTTIDYTNNQLVSSTGVNYQWMLDNNELNGENNQSLSPQENGCYTVVISDNNCTDTSSCYNMIDVSIGEFSNANYNVYPNPTKDILNIAINNKSAFKGVLFDGAGKVVFDFNNQNIISLRELPKGVYFLQIETVENVFMERIIKQ